MISKTCTRCGQDKPLSEFKSDSRRAGGKAASCKACNTGVGFVAAGELSDLGLYDQARALLAQAKAVDEVKAIQDKAAALREYARRAADRTLLIDATEIIFDAERKMGEMLIAQRQTVGFNCGSRGQLRGRDESGTTVSEAPVDERPKLAEVGITHKHSSRAQRLAALSPKDYQARIDAWRAEVAAGQVRVTVDLMKIGAEQQQREARRKLAIDLSNATAALASGRRYPAIYFDPPWKRKQGITDRSYENHYPTMTWDEIIEWARSMRDRLLDDAWGFMWIPRAHLLALHPAECLARNEDGELIAVTVKIPLAWAVADAMGFDAYSTCFVWTKTDEEHPDDIGSGILVRDQDEILLMFKKGRGLPKPASNEVEGSNHRERSKPLGHSRKPQFYREMIARMVGEGVPVLECFARHDEQFPLPEKWDAWGNQAQPQQEEVA